MGAKCFVEVNQQLASRQSGAVVMPLDVEVVDDRCAEPTVQATYRAADEFAGCAESGAERAEGYGRVCLEVCSVQVFDDVEVERIGENPAGRVEISQSRGGVAFESGPGCLVPQVARFSRSVDETSGSLPGALWTSTPLRVRSPWQITTGESSDSPISTTRSALCRAVRRSTASSAIDSVDRTLVA